MRKDSKAPPKLQFHSSGLDLSDVRALFEKLARSTLGQRAVRELEPRPDEDARAALRRTAEFARLVA
ncbi:MAG: hypothetical protein HUU28_17395, partial [Planctomycetaceae bacterium]|nr:hypothetical protein [Planctomycetaceae bacterium]